MHVFLDGQDARMKDVHTLTITMAQVAVIRRQQKDLHRGSTLMSVRLLGARQRNGLFEFSNELHLVGIILTVFAVGQAEICLFDV